MIALQEIQFGYRRRTPIYQGLSLRLESGRVYGLLGSNGVGKTTLFKLIAGLLSPAKGEIDVLGERPDRRRVSLYRRMFVLPEEFELPAVRFKTFVAITAPFYPRFSQERLEECCQALEVDPACNLKKLSMGQKKRALIAFALACRTELLLLDEPTNGLDIPAKAAFRRLVASGMDDHTTVILSTHQVRDVDVLLDSVVILDAQGVVLNASIEQIAQRLSFGPKSTTDQPLYSEESLQGTIGVGVNLDGAECKPDLELLFNASLHCRAQLAEIFHQ
ncbi:MAG: ABC transporter ATP-binding protein [Alistipes sp.]|nr:ABC transporter ATP-binding protein [Alistipes sp.]